MNYMKQLDAIRALGVSLIFYQHFVRWSVKPLTFYGHQILFGVTAVDSFFVMSGFLITGILLKSKDKVEHNKATVLSSLKTFYTRRTLRIFPIFYLTLLVTFTLNIHPVRETIWWHVFYASNIYSVVADSVNNGAISHLWSLSVEEQFYLVWPLVILLVPRKQLAAVLTMIILSAPAFRYYCGSIHMNSAVANAITPGNIDLLGIGALLAYLKTYRPEKLPAFLKLSLGIGCPMFLVSVLSSSFALGAVFGAFTRTFEGLWICWFIDKASEGFGGALGYVLELKPLSYLGKISYGLYLYHNFVPSLLNKMLHMLHVTGPQAVWSQCFFYTAVSVAIASLSWHLIEKPLLGLKHVISPNSAIKYPVIASEQRVT